jgi:hypothetical protein
VIRYGPGAAIECLAAWVLEPALQAPGAALAALLPDSTQRSLRDLQRALCDRKHDRQLREDLAWEVVDVRDCALRAGKFIEDIGRIAAGSARNDPNWTQELLPSRVTVFTAQHIAKS